MRQTRAGGAIDPRRTSGLVAPSELRPFLDEGATYVPTVLSGQPAPATVTAGAPKDLLAPLSHPFKCFLLRSGPDVWSSVAPSRVQLFRDGCELVGGRPIVASLQQQVVTLMKSPSERPSRLIRV
jgi:hypothetical protein